MSSRETEARGPSLSEIAAHAGLSRSLVSLALRGERGVSDDSRRRAIEAARALGKTPSAHALRMLDGRPIVGVLVTDLRNPFHTDVVLGVERHAGSAAVLVGNGARDVERMRGYLQDFDALDIGGVVIVSSWLSPADIADAGRRRPVVVVGSSVSHVPGTDTVRGDVQAGIRQAMEHLVAEGHRRIGFVSESDHSSSRRRHAAYLEQMARFLQDRGTVSTHIDDLVETPGRLRELVLEGGFTAFIAANDVTAIALMRAAADAGLRVPHDVAIVGYDNISSSRLVSPGLTTVDQPWESMGARALEMLRERAVGRLADRDDVFAPSLIVRGSTSAPVPAAVR